MASVLKDVNGDIGNHLRRHVHLTNCIHMKSQMHKNSPISSDTSFIRDLVVLQRSRSLMDPSASQSMLQSPSVTDLISKGEENGKNLKQNGMQTENADIDSQFRGRLSQIQHMADGAETSIRGYNRGLDSGKRRKFRSTRRSQTSKAPKDEMAPSKILVASKTIADNFGGQKYPSEGGEQEYEEQNLTRGLRNGRGMWSSLHHRKSTPKLKNGGSLPREKDFVDSSSSVKCKEEALPLLVDVSLSQQNTSTADWENDYSGELGIYADNLLNHEIDSNKVSEVRTGGQHRSRRHQILTQKYTPRTFEDIVGQKLVAQALSNSVAKNKVGLVYVFYGPHGAGKTSAARVFARALNCQSLGKMKPCGFCSFCKAYDKGKTRNVKEVGPVSNLDFDRIMNLLDNLRVSPFPSQYKVFIFDDCDKMSTNCWSALSKVIDRAPRRVVFILVCSSLDVLPHVIISRCQKFLFPKLKDADIVHALRSIATSELLDIEENALNIIASRSDGSLRDAEMTLEQLSLLGQRITVSLVQELVGLVSDEKLVDLLDLALSADTVNTVKSLREILESGVEPLSLMSQLAMIITCILAGTYDLTEDRSRRKFFLRQPLSREHMEKLRQALKTLSVAENQLRMSNDRSTWLITTLLQLTYDQHSSPIFQGESGLREGTRRSAQTQGNYSPNRRHENSLMNPEQSTSLPNDINKISDRRLSDIVYKDLEQIWSEVLEKIQERRLKEFMYKEAKLISLRFDKVPTVQLMFSSQLTKVKAKSYEAHLLQAFESVLGSPLRIETRCELKEAVPQEIVETDYTEEAKNIKHKDENTKDDAKDPEITVVGDDESSCKKSTVTSVPEGSSLGEQSRRMSLVKSKVTLAQVIRHSDRSNRRALSMDKDLEQENLRLEPITRSLLCCKALRRRHRKHPRSKIHYQKPKVLVRFVSCGKCLSSKSPSRA